MTCDHALVLADDALFREAGYTALSRGRLGNRLYVMTVDTPEDRHGHAPVANSGDPIDGLIATLGNSRKKSLAIDRYAALESLRRARGPVP